MLGRAMPSAEPPVLSSSKGRAPQGFQYLEDVQPQKSVDRRRQRLAQRDGNERSERQSAKGSNHWKIFTTEGSEALRIFDGWKSAHELFQGLEIFLPRVGITSLRSMRSFAV